MSEIRQFNLFKFRDQTGKVTDIKGFLGQLYSVLGANHSALNSVFKAVDENGSPDNQIQANEMNMLNKITMYVDKMLDSANNDGVVDVVELEEFSKKLKDGSIDLKDIFKMEFTEKKQSISEGLDRKITKINVSKSMYEPKVLEELKAIADEQGFEIQEIESGGDPWIEDSQIKRQDGKTYLSYHQLQEKLIKHDYVSSRGNVSNNLHGRVIVEGNAFNINIDNERKYYGTSYLEGGNVLNTKLSDGSAGAIVGDASVGLTLDLMKLEHTPENIKKVKAIIAEDLGLELNKVTFIPQHEFHVDVTYHPMKNGEIAIPDYKEGAKILTEMLNKLGEEINAKKLELFEPSGEALPKSEVEKLNKIKNRQDSRRKKEIDLQYLEIKAMALRQKINELRGYMKATMGIRAEANDYLARAGYKLVRIPYFSTGPYEKTNYINGVGGTSEKTGQTFFITNKSEYAELDEYVEKYFAAAGVDKVYFVSSTDKLSDGGGIDCLTIEE